MADYGAAKARLFASPGLATAVVNADDAFGERVAAVARERGARVLTYGVNGGDVTATAIATTADGMALSVATPWGRGDLATRVVGTFNVANLLGTLGVLLAGGLPLGEALAAMAAIEPPPGRMQRQGGGDLPLVVIDYAHTPDALEKVLAALRSAVGEGGALVCLFGCGGDRDPGKRREMGRIAATLADRVVVTSDNPRGEDPTTIAMAIAEGVRDAGNRHWRLEVDRAKAIREAIAAARAGDVVLLAGKGHEDYQEANGVRTPFSDAVEAGVALARRSAR
jgi:UDP-N-acetylmuramoyl-L-alanyl-D-glutamate--2,6-diaminopimelate ligase